MPKTFTPPTSDEQPRLKVTSRGPAARLFSYYPTHRVGVNIYKYADGSYSTDSPVHTTAQVEGDVAPVLTYYGGHIYTVDDTEAAALTAAGFGVNLSNPPNTIDQNPPAHTFDPLGADITAGVRQLVAVPDTHNPTDGVPDYYGGTTPPGTGLPTSTNTYDSALYNTAVYG